MTTCTWTLEAYLSAAWVDITGDVLSKDKLSWSWGLSGGTPFDRTARTGQMNFSLNNNGGIYSPGHASCTAGWQLGVPIKLTLTYDNVNYRYRYYVSGIDINPGLYGQRSVRVSLVDWMDYPAKYPMTMTGLQLSKRADQALTTIASALPVAPQSTNYQTGTNTFVSIFDTITDKTRALSEISKLMNSELGYCILKKDATNGETLTFENYLNRSGLQDLTDITSPLSSPYYVLKEDGDKLLQENGDRIILDEYFNVSAVNTMNNASVDYGKDIINFVEAKTTPRHVDTSLITLFSLQQPLEIGSGQTITIKGNYTDPATGRPIHADTANMVLPCTTDSDIEAWSSYTGSGISAKAGSGTDISAWMTITSSTYGTDGFSHDVQNVSGLSGYFTKFRQRGYGIYTWDEVTYQEDSSDSENEFGYSPRSLTQDYKNDLVYGTLFVEKVVEENKEPVTVLKKVTFKATTGELIQAFLNLDIGSLVAIKEDVSGVDGYYYINAVEASLIPTSVASNATIEFTWTLQQFYKINKGLSLYTVELTTDSTNLAIDFGYIPELCNITGRSISAWIYPTADATSDSTDPSRVIVANYSDASGFDLAIKNELKLGYNQVQTTSDVAMFETSTDAVTLNQWNHVIVTRDTATNAPLFYVNGVNKPTTTLTAQTTANANDNGSHLFVGNIKTASWDYSGSFLGKIVNLRIYNNYVLSASDIAALYAADRNDYLTCIYPQLSFWTPAIYTVRQADYVGSGIAPGKNVIDAVRWYVGKPSATAPNSGKVYTTQPDAADGIDTYIDKAVDSTNFGTATVIKIGSDGISSAYAKRGLLKFDLSKGTNPPAAGSNVITAVMTITPVTDASVNGRTLSLYRCKRNWVEAEATWNVYSTGNWWQTTGADGALDRESDLLGSVYVPENQALNVPIDITLDVGKVQEWVSGTFSNYGMVMRVDGETQDCFYYASSDHATVSYRPKLVINYI